MEAWFLSDIHLKSDQERNGEILLRFLYSLKRNLEQEQTVFLLGDIFDLWIGDHKVFARMYAKVISALTSLRDQGFKIVFIEGNHDVHIDGYFKNVLNIDVFVEAQLYQIDNLRVRVEHGDLINTEDAAYLRYRSFIRQPFMKILAEMLPGFLWKYIGERASSKSREFSSKYRHDKEQELLGHIRRHADKLLSTTDIDVVISGHMHVFDEYQAVNHSKQLTSYNLGSWLGEDKRVLHYKSGTWRWIQVK